MLNETTGMCRQKAKRNHKDIGRAKCLNILCMKVTNSLVCECILNSMCVFVNTLTQQKSTVLEVGGAEGLVRDMISWMARRSFRRCNGLLIPISLWISVSDSADIMAPLFTLARHAATYQAGMPTHSWPEEGRWQTCLLAFIQVNCYWFEWFSDPLCLCHTSSQTTTVGPSHWANGRPCLRASSSNSCLRHKIYIKAITQ